MAVSPIQQPLGRDFCLQTRFILLSRVTFAHMYGVLVAGKKSLVFCLIIHRNGLPRINMPPVQK